MQCCPLTTGDDAEAASFSTISIVKARKPHKCCECNETIAPGQQYERCTGLWDHGFDTFATCLSCVEIRDHFRCDGEGCEIGQLWSDLRDNFFPTMKAGGPCMEGLSSDARARLFAKRLEWMGAR